MDNGNPVRNTVLSACSFFAAVSGASVCRECVLQKGRKMENRIYNITEKTTLGELLAILQLGERPVRTPSPKQLRETAGEPVAGEERCTVYRNGWAIYDNGSGCTVVWLPDCLHFTYSFVEAQAGEDLAGAQEYALPEGLLASQPWPVAVTLVGDHRVEANLLNRKGSRKGTRYAADILYGSGEGEDILDDRVLADLAGAGAYKGENPESVYIRKEMLRERLAAMTEKQRRAFILCTVYGFTQKEAAAKLGITQPAVSALVRTTIRKWKEKR